MDRRRVHHGPPIGRHVAAVGLLVALMLIFIWIGIPDDRDGPPYVSHTLLADTSLVLLCFVLMLGPVARFVPRLRPVVPWGRELGIAMFVTAGLHTALLLEPDFDLIEFFGGRNSRGEFEFGDGMWDASNWVGVVALGYALVLFATSNDLSQRWLGRGWKFVQRQSYTLFLLAWLHTAAFVLLEMGHGSSFLPWFLAFTLMATVAQFAGFVHTVRSARGPSPYRVPPKTVTAGTNATALGVLRWLGVGLLWGGVITGSWALATAPSVEDKALARFCERYEEVQGLPRAQMLEEMANYLPTDDPTDTVQDSIRNCENR